MKKVVAGTRSKLTRVDHGETYGRHILKKATRNLKPSLCVDLGCGGGDDLLIIKNRNHNCRCVGIDFRGWNKEKLTSLDIELLEINVENQPLPFDDESVDIIIANQIFEHAKEIYWINHEIFRSLKIGGYLYLGVPNVLSFHNRILGIFGIHPTNAKLISAHIRSFSKKDTFLFYREIGRGVVSIESFYGSQFYPFPKMLARPLATVFPSLAFSIFFLIRKTAKYNNEFIEWPSMVRLETNYYTGAAQNKNF